MQKRSTDGFLPRPIDQNLYFAQNLPGRAPRSAMMQEKRAETHRLPEEFKMVLRFIKLFLAACIYPLHFFFCTLPAFLNKQLNRVIDFILVYLEKASSYLYVTLWRPICAYVKKVFWFFANPLSSFYKKGCNLVVRTTRGGALFVETIRLCCREIVAELKDAPR